MITAHFGEHGIRLTGLLLNIEHLIMKLSFLNKRLTVVLVSVIIGLFIGFKWANSQYRDEKGASLRNAVAQASGQMAGSQSVNSSSSQNLTPEQRNEMINQTRA